jgi:glycosyltransferase involved in cell wall biosynthesis
VQHRRRILFLNWRDTSHPEGGGSERYLEQLAGWLAAEGDEVSIHCAAHDRGPRTEDRDGYRIHRRGGRVSVYLHGLLAVLRLRPDVVVDVQNHVPFFSVLVHRRVAVLVHHVSKDQWRAVFGPVFGGIGWWIEAWLAPKVYRRAPYLAVSAATRDDLMKLGVDGHRISVVHNATDPKPETRSDETAPAPTPTLCVVARLVPHKRVEHAVDLLARLVDDFPDLRMRIVGDGPSRGRIMEHAGRLGVMNRIDLLGGVNEQIKHEVIATSWVLVCPSLKEGWGRVVMEAAIHNVPTVAYQHAGGLSESVVHGATGLLASDLDDLVKQTRMLLEDNAKRIAFGEAAAAHAATFTPTRTVAEFRTALWWLAGDRRTSTAATRRHG